MYKLKTMYNYKTNHNLVVLMSMHDAFNHEQNHTSNRPIYTTMNVTDSAIQQNVPEQRIIVAVNQVSPHYSFQISL